MEIKLTEEEWKTHKTRHDELSKDIRKTALVVLTYCFFCFLSLGQSDVVVVIDTAMLKIPFANTDISPRTFLVVGPLILILLTAYLHVFIREHSKITTLHPNDKLPYIFNLESWFTKALTVFTFYALPAIIMLAFAERVFPRPDRETWFILAGLMCGSLLWIFILNWNLIAFKFWSRINGLIATVQIILVGDLYFMFPDNDWRKSLLLILLVLWILNWVLILFGKIKSSIWEKATGYLSGILVFVGSLFILSLVFEEGSNSAEEVVWGAMCILIIFWILHWMICLFSRKFCDRWGFISGFLATAVVVYMGVVIFYSVMIENPVKLNLRDAKLIEHDLRGYFLGNADLHGAHLNNAKLQEAKLQRADLTGAHLNDANLNDANLRGVKIKGADLTGAQLQGAQLQDVDLSEIIRKGIDLTGVDLREAELTGADLDKAKLIEANLGGAKLKGASLRKAELNEANLRKAWLNGADLRDANLQGAVLNNAILRATQLRGANLNKAELQGVDFTGADLSGANLTVAMLEGANFTGAKLIRARLIRAKLKGVKFQGTNFKEAELGGADFQGVNLESMNFKKAYLNGAKFNEASLQGVSLIEADLKWADFTGANLTGAYLRNAKLGDAKLKKAKLKDADLDSSDLIFADLRGAEGLTAEQVKQAKSWSQAFYDNEFRKQLGITDDQLRRLFKKKYTRDKGHMIFNSELVPDLLKFYGLSPEPNP